MEDGLTSLEREKQADACRRLDELAYNDAISGQDSGRMARFGGSARKHDEREKKRSEKAFRDALDRLLQDPEYRALYEALGERLSSAEIEADAVIADLQADLRTLETQINDMETRAAKGPDGEAVFKTADGRTVGIDGQELPPEIAEGIIWPPNAPSVEDYFAARQRRDGTAALLDQWQDYRNDTLGGIRDRYEDRENPISKDDIRDAEREIEDIAPKISSLPPEPSEFAAVPVASIAQTVIPTALK